MDEAECCDRVLLLRDGELLSDDTVPGLLAATGADDLEGAFLALVIVLPCRLLSIVAWMFSGTPTHDVARGARARTRPEPSELLARTHPSAVPGRNLVARTSAGSGVPCAHAPLRGPGTQSTLTPAGATGLRDTAERFSVEICTFRVRMRPESPPAPAQAGMTTVSEVRSTSPATVATTGIVERRRPAR